VAVGLLLSLLAFDVSNGKVHLAPHQFFNPLLLTFSFVGALVATRHPRNPIGWILCAIGFLAALDLLALGYGMYSRAVTPDGSLPGAGLATWLDDWIWVIPVFMPFTFLILLFPDGRLLSPRWQPVAWMAGLGLAAFLLLQALGPGTGADAQAAGVLPLSAGAAYILGGIAAISLLVGVLGSIASLVVRFSQSRGAEREQVKWLVYGVSLALLIVFLGNGIAGFSPGGDPLQLGIISIGVSVLSIIVAIGIAIVRHHLYDIDLIINRTLVYGTLTTLIVGVYIAVVSGLGVVFQAQGEPTVSLLATGIVAVGFQPLRERLQRGINRLMYGQRDDPFAVISRLGERLEGAFAPDAMLATLVETIAHSLRLPYAAIELGSEAENRITSSFGRPSTDPEQFSLTFQREVIGRLLVGSRSAGEKFNLPERHLLANIARQAGAAVHAAQLAVDLQRSRVQLVTAREEERRRLRRDLHDGLGPTLAALHLQAGSARRSIRSEPENAEIMLDDLRAELKSLIDEIRRIAYGLRPPALDELGLVGAIESLSARMRHDDDRSHDANDATIEPRELRQHHVSVQAFGDLKTLPAAVEVAAYHIVQEALLNSMRYAQASQHTVHLNLEDALNLEIIDDGKGLPPQYHAGVGMLSMRERAAELGGWCSVESLPAGGTVVHAHLPVVEP
jgi:signal transduction histidine kinase